MSRHATAVELSAYLDEELEAPRLVLIRGHLEECEECRRKAESLGSVKRDLRRMEALEAPPALGQHLLARIHREPRPASLLERLEARIAAPPGQSAVGFTFAMVVAFAALLYLFAGSLDRHQRNQTSILRPDLPQIPAEAPADVPGEGTVEGPPGQPAPESFATGGLAFEKASQGRWRQVGLAEGADAGATALPFEGEEAAGILARLPELEALLSAGNSVLLEDGGRVVLLRP